MLSPREENGVALVGLLTSLPASRNKMRDLRGLGKYLLGRFARLRAPRRLHLVGKGFVICMQVDGRQQEKETR